MRKIAVIGSDGRGAAIARKFLEQDCQVAVIPGNAGMDNWKHLTRWRNKTDYSALAIKLKWAGCELAVVSPEAPLCQGIVDAFMEAGMPIVGPTKAAAALEESKIFCSMLLREAGVAIPNYSIFFEREDATELKEYLRQEEPPYVIKCDGLMAGKGVLVTSDYEKACQFADLHADKGGFVLQKYLAGQECSFEVLTNGYHAIPLLPARDYKRALDGDEGENTGGMGSYAPFPMSQSKQKQIMDEIVYPTLAQMRRIGRRYRGIMYFGLMLTADGPKVLEINCRLGDPETESRLPLLDSELFPLLLATTQDGELEKMNINFQKACAVTITLAASGYPQDPKKGDIVSGIEAAEADGTYIYPAGVGKDIHGRLVTAGGRVLYITATGETFEQARNSAYDSVHKITFSGMQYRTDIAKECLAYAAND